MLANEYVLSFLLSIFQSFIVVSPFLGAKFWYAATLGAKFWYAVTQTKVGNLTTYYTSCTIVEEGTISGGISERSY